MLMQRMFGRKRPLLLAAVAIMGLAAAGEMRPAFADELVCRDLDQRWVQLKPSAEPPQLGQLAMLAAEKGCMDLITDLLTYPEMEHARDRHGVSILQRAAKAGQIEVMKLLIAKGADVIKKFISP